MEFIWIVFWVYFDYFIIKVLRVLLFFLDISGSNLLLVIDLRFGRGVIS